jgi:hypothetical protein
MMDKLRAVEFELWNSIIEHKEQDAPIIIIQDLERAHQHIVDAMTILKEE